jgi:hypothetical protein
MIAMVVSSGWIIGTGPPFTEDGSVTSVAELLLASEIALRVWMRRE